MVHNEKTAIRCVHCGDECLKNAIKAGEKTFCCDGCKTVYEILNEHGLCEYYDLNAHPGLTQKISVRKDKYAFLDVEEIASKIIQFSGNGQLHVTFYLPQVHCSSCLWLLENIHRVEKGVISSRVNFPKKEVFIVFDKNTTTLRKVVEALTSIGYEPHLSLDDVTSRQANKTDRTRWYKIGIAGFCFSNIMMMSFPEYFGMSATLEPAFKAAITILIVALSIPVLFYAASEFFISAWKGLKHKHLNIDAPIALALVITFGRSLYEIITATGPGYLDSMTGIVFFMLVGRWLQDRTYKSISFDRDFKSFFPIAVNVLQNNTVKPVPVNDVKVNDIVQIHHRELIPVDVILSKGEAEIDYSFVTGESVAVKAAKGEIIYAGGKQMGGLIEALVVKEVSQSYLTNLWNKENYSIDKKSQYSFIDTISKYFTYVVFAVGILAFAYWFNLGKPGLAWNAITTILIVACPCALLLTANFTRGNILRILSLNKFYVRNASVIEAISNIDHIVFDKTGTLTQSNKMRVQYEGKLLDEDLKIKVASLLHQSVHPLGKAIIQYLQVDSYVDVENYKVVDGKGIEGWIDDQYIKLGSPLFTGATEQQHTKSAVVIVVDNEQLGVFNVSNSYRYGIFDVIKELKKTFGISVISGDNDAELPVLKQQLGKDSDILFEQSPYEKLEYIKHVQSVKQQQVMMVGDGLNDAAALQQSNVGIAVTDDDNNFTPAADGIIHASRVAILDKLLAYAKKGKTIILFTFMVSIVYNITGLYFALQGTLSPLIAAILMPSSTISIIFITYGLSEWMALRMKLKPNKVTI